MSVEHDKIRVMLVDDSAVIRGLISRTLEQDPDVEIVSSVHNGQMAVSAIKKANPDVVVLDIEMPVMDGITALPLLLQEKPDAKILMCSTLSRQGASISIKALSLGATECLVKPTSNAEVGGSEEFKAGLLRLVRALGSAQARARPRSVTATASARTLAPAQKVSHDFKLRDKMLAYQGKPSIVAIGSSTGGPQALFETLKHMKGITVPIVITQHMPKTFTALLAEHIAQNCGIPCFEGQSGMAVKPGNAYVAPGGQHMEIIREGTETMIRLNDDPPENYCKPSVEPMMRSVISLYDKKALAVMLTGMGNDGMKSFQMLAEKGGNVIAQDEKTSVVWGMPGAVAMAGICTEVLPLQEIGPWVRKKVTGM